MKNKWLIVYFLCGVIGLYAAPTDPDYAIGNIPDSIAKQAFRVVRQKKLDFDVSKSGHTVMHYHIAFTMFAQVNDLAEYMSYDKFSKVKNIKGTYYDANGRKIRTVEKSEIQDQTAYDGVTLVTDDRLKIVPVSYGVLPYTFELEYDIEYSEFRGYGSYVLQRYTEGVEKFDLKITAPEAYKPTFRMHNGAPPPHITTIEDRGIYHWQAIGLKPVKKEAFMPNSRLLLPFIELATSQILIDGFKIDTKNWKSYGASLYALNKDRDDLSPGFATEVLKMTADKATNREKIAVLYQYMQKNIRYVSIQLGIGGLQTFDARFVERNKYGDCKALVNFMKAMLKTVGIPAYTCAVSSGEDDFFNPDPDFCRMGFNHVILYIPDEDIWMECTSTNAPMGYLGLFTANRYVLAFKETGGELLKTPAVTAQDNLSESTAVVKIDKDGSAKLDLKTILRGGVHENWRAMKTSATADEVKRLYQSQQHLPTGEVAAFDIQIMQGAPQVAIDYSIQMPRYANVSGTRLFIPFNLHNPLSISGLEADTRQAPIHFDIWPLLERDTVHILLPIGYGIESIPFKDQEWQTPFGTFTLKVLVLDDRITIIRQLELQPSVQPASEFTAMKAFFKKIQSIDNSKIVLKVKA